MDVPPGRLVDLSEAQARTVLKVEGAAALGAVGGLVLAVSRKSPVILTTVATTTSAAAAAGCFSVLQEGARLARGKHDAWNSVAAGACAGAALVGIQAGPRYRVFGALAWGSICGAGHLLHNAIQPRQTLERLLIQADLLDPPEKRKALSSSGGATQTSPEGTLEGQPAASTSQATGDAALTEAQELRRKLAEVRQLRAKELQELRAKELESSRSSSSSQQSGSSLRQPPGKSQEATEEAAAQQGAVAEGTAAGSSSKPQSSWWWRWRS